MAIDTETFLAAVGPMLCYLWWFVALAFVRVGQAQHAKAEGASYDNRDPRKQQSELTGLGRRAVNSMNNHAEGFPFFAIAVALNIAVRGPNHGSLAVAITALAHAAFRLGHLVAYLADIDAVRSIMFTGGLVCNWVLYGYVLAA